VSPAPPLPGQGHLEETFASLGTRLDHAQSTTLSQYTALLLLWSRRMNLTAHRGAEKVHERLLLDGAIVAEVLPQGLGSVHDVGAGAGALATTLRVVRPDLGLTLVEPRAKRATFLRTVRRELALERFEVIEGRAEELELGAAEAIYSRAVMPPDRWLPFASPLVRPGGQVLCLSTAKLDRASIPQDLVLEEERRYVLPQSQTPRFVSRLVRRP